MLADIVGVLDGEGRGVCCGVCGLKSSLLVIYLFVFKIFSPQARHCSMPSVQASSQICLRYILLFDAFISSTQREWLLIGSAALLSQPMTRLDEHYINGVRYLLSPLAHNFQNDNTK